MGAPPTTTATAKAPTDRLVGWLPAGMLDWPGRLTATLFLGGCDFRCPFCHNAALVAPPAPPASWDDLAAYVSSKRDWLDGVVITGGEPTLDPGLPDLLRYFADTAVPVKLDTNGNHPEVLSALLAEELIAFVALDVKTILGRYPSLTGRAGSDIAVAQSIEAIIGSGVPHEFRTTAYPGAVMLDDLESIARLLEGGDRYAVQQFAPETTLDPRAAGVLPYRPDALREAVASCNRYIPTVLRGA